MSVNLEITEKLRGEAVAAVLYRDDPRGERYFGRLIERALEDRDGDSAVLIAVAIERLRQTLAAVA